MLTLSSPAAVGQAAAAGIKWLTYYYSSPTNDGAWDQQIIQWHESGQFWNTILFYRTFAGSNDSSLDNLVNSQLLLATYRDQGDFLDEGGGAASVYLGRWNDDIAWWALTAITAAEIWGPSSNILDPSGQTQGGRSWVYVADKTFNHMLEQWDSICNGGIYWSRNRNDANPARKYYKSSITNAEAIDLAARLYAVTKNETYKVWSDRIYDWMKTTVISASDYSVADGVMADGSCALTPTPWTYHSGELIYGLLSLYATTKNQTYMSEASKHVSYTLSKFVNPSTGAIWDPSCDYNGGNTYCKSPSGYAWPLYRAFGRYYVQGSDNDLRTKILSAMRATANENFKNCDSTWNCIRTLNPGETERSVIDETHLLISKSVPSQYTFPNGTNPRDQIETMEIINALSEMTGYKPLTTVQPTSPTPSKSAAQSVLYFRVGHGTAVFLASFVFLAFVGSLSAVVLL
ncbi:glycosyl hydrolase family 76-domain-containing protein [Zopfochytrium polystomum]|nr:glycosyl hydrolase family 76-domain-containing protein [Zopfochytrium polystomum]